MFCLQEEKKFFQMELVNRETNFNKVFSASPNVGILNPLDAKVGNCDTHIKPHPCRVTSHG